MSWIIERIDEADFGCEERMPGEPLMVLVRLRSDDGRMTEFEMPEKWLVQQNLDEGDEWPLDIDGENENDVRVRSQAEWLEKYMGALEELND